MAGHSLGIFATQARSKWGRTLIAQGKNDFGHKDVRWPCRALLAMSEAGIVGQTLTTLEIADAIIPFIGTTKSKSSRAAIAVIGIEEGVIEATGTWRRPEGHIRKLREYKIKGHMEIQDDGHMIPVFGEHV